MLIRNSKIALTTPSVQEQQGSSDCGLFILAYATCLCVGDDPAQVSYVQYEFRSHFLNSLVSKKIMPFQKATRQRTVQKPNGQLPYNILLARSACLRYAGCEHFVSALGPSALGWGKVSRILKIFAFVPFFLETTYQLIPIGPRFYKNVIIFLFSRKRQQKLITCC